MRGSLSPGLADACLCHLGCHLMLRPGLLERLLCWDQGRGPVPRWPAPHAVQARRAAYVPALPFGQKAPQDRHLSLPLAGLSARLRRGRKRVRGLHVHLESAPRRTGPTRIPGEGPSLFWNPWTPSSPRSRSQPSSPQSDFAWPPCSTQPPVAGVARGLVLLSLSPGGSLPLTGCSCFRCIPRR